MIDVQGVAGEKVVMAPLGGLTVDPQRREISAGVREGEPFTVAFIGRMARQKAPEVFLGSRASTPCAPATTSVSSCTATASWRPGSMT